MATVQTTSTVQAPICCAYKVVEDIENYPQFVPACKEARILSKTQKDDCEHIQASLLVSLGPFSQSLTTANVNRENQSITIALHSGKVKHLRGKWTFTEKSLNVTEVRCEIDYSLGSAKLNTVINIMLKKFLVQLSAAFITRAEDLARQQTVLL